jgi:serine/threonine protein kinase
VATTQHIRRSHYRSLGLVGHGQFGRVYCAMHRKTGQLVAIKDLHRDRFPTHKFLRELRFLISLEHPNIVTCHALEHSSSGRQLVLGYCEGGNLRSILASDTVLTLEEILGFMLDILSALDHAHRQGIVHCDIKPENILLQLTPGGWTARISDFGIARLSQECHGSDMGHTGSPAYMAPERFYNQHPEASDLYAVGVILYELLLGYRPFSGTPLELMVAHLNQPPDIPESLVPEFREILIRSLQKLLPKRFKSAREMRQAVVKVYQQIKAGAIEQSGGGKRALPLVTAAPELPFIELPHGTQVMGFVPLASGLGPSRQPGPTAPTANLLITCCDQQVWFYHWSDQLINPPSTSQGFALPALVRQFVSTAQGGVLITDNSVHLLSMSHGLGRIATTPEPMQAAIAPSGRWFALGRSLPEDDHIHIGLRQMVIRPATPVKVSSVQQMKFPLQGGDLVTILAIDNAHLAVVVGQRYRSTFHIATRRGHYIGALEAQVPIHSLVPTSRPYRYMAQEVGHPNALLILDLKPFRMTRYRMDLEPQWLFETAVGYGGVDPQGCCSLVNEEGEIINRLSGLPVPMTMAQLSPTRFLWGTSTEHNSRIYTLDLAQLALDIGF